MADTLASLTAALTDRYRIQREIGQGGMATVFLARDTKHDRPVALKVLRPELGAVLGVERFLSEIRVTATCSTRTFCRCSTAVKRTVCSSM